MRGADALGDNFRRAGDPRTAKSAIGNWAVRACRGPHATGRCCELSTTLTQMSAHMCLDLNSSLTFKCSN